MLSVLVVQQMWIEELVVVCRASLLGTKGEERTGYVRRDHTSQACDALKLLQKTWLQLCEAFKKKEN